MKYRVILLNVVAVLVLVEGLSGQYYGKIISSDWGENSTISGDVYAIDNNTIQIINFTYITVGNCSTIEMVKSSLSGTNITRDPLTNLYNTRMLSKSYSGEDLTLQLPSGAAISDYTRLVISCPMSDSNEEGGVDIPLGFVSPAPHAVGQFRSRAHGVSSGAVTVLNDRQIMIKSFYYDGQGPDAFFYAGVTNSVQLQNSPYGKIPDENGDSVHKAGAYAGVDVILTLPSTISVRNLSWLSMYCITYSHNFGEVSFPDNMNIPPYQEPRVIASEPPTPQIIGQFSSRAHRVSSGNVTVLNDRQIEIKSFNYDGQGPDAFFYVGITGSVQRQLIPYGKIPDEKGIRDRKAGAYSNKDIILTLPSDISIHDLKWLSMYCITYDHNFGEVFFPDSLNVPVYEDIVVPEPQIIGQFSSRAHRVSSGNVTVLNDRQIEIKSFNYDGQGPDAFFYVGTTDSVGRQLIPYGKIPDENGISDSKAGAYSNKDIILTLPSDISIHDLKWLSMYCITYDHNFGEVFFPDSLNVPVYEEIVIPEPKIIGQFSSHFHGVSSGNVTVLNERQIEIKSFNYDGLAPDAFFYVGTTDSVQSQTLPYGKIADENGISFQPGAYVNKDIILTLPYDILIHDLKWLSMYDLLFDLNLGEVYFPDTLNVPEYEEPSIEEMNCEPLSNELQISWKDTEDEIVFELAGKIDRNTDYMAFGFSGSLTSYRMMGADIVVCDFRENHRARAIDYYISGYSQCNGRGRGVCPDATNNVKLLSAKVTDGIVSVRYSRTLISRDDRADRDYLVNGTAQQIVWAIGPLNSNKEAAKHYPNKRIAERKAIDFGRTRANNCPSLSGSATTEPPKPDFKPHHIYGRPGNKTTFTAEIGQSAQEQGYTALTGLPSWGIAWYIDGILIPELHLQRGVSYTFNVSGGYTTTMSGQYHPFYFTNSSLGGFFQSSGGTVYPGRNQTYFAVGSYCEWKFTSDAVRRIANGHVYQCFEEMKRDLYRDCESYNPRYGQFVWTPDGNTPDLVYYQCATHKNLGWKVHIYDQLPATEIQNVGC